MPSTAATGGDGTQNTTTLPTSSTAPSHPQSGTRVYLDEEILDDVLYLARSNDLVDLQQTIADLVAQPHAEDQGERSTVSILVALVDPDTGNTPLHFAAANGNVDVLKWLISVYTDASTSPVAASGPSLLVERVDYKNAQGNTPLHYAAMTGEMASIRLLLAAGADMDSQNDARRSPALEAEMAGHDSAFFLLLGLGSENGEGSGGGEAGAEENGDVEMLDEVADSEEGFEEGSR